MICTRHNERAVNKALDNIRKVELQGNDSTTITQYLGKTTKISNNDFVKYGFSFFQEDDLLINQIDNSSIRKFNDENKVEYLELLEKSIFPTITYSEIDENKKYFGSTIINNSTIFIYLDIPENIGIVKLFDEIDSDVAIYTISFDEIEKQFRKGLCIFINKEKAVLKISYQSWIDSNEHSMRNLNKVFLRNDEYNNNKGKVKIAKNLDKYSDYVIDLFSGTILSNTEKTSYDVDAGTLPIYSRYRLLSDSSTTHLNWDNWSVYDIGDVVNYNNKQWTSLVKNNQGNIPELSSCWDISENLVNYHTNTFEVLLNLGTKIVVESDNVGKVYPDNTVNIYRENPDNSFYIKLNPGYSITDQIKLKDGNGGVVETVNLSSNRFGIEHKRTQDFSDVIELKNIDSLINNKVEELSFDLEKNKYSLIISLASDSLEKFDERAFNESFNMYLNGKLLAYRSSGNIVLRLNGENVIWSDHVLGTGDLDMSDIDVSIENEKLLDDVEKVGKVAKFYLEGIDFVDDTNTNTTSIKGTVTEIEYNNGRITKDTIIDSNENTFIVDYENRKIGVKMVGETEVTEEYNYNSSKRITGSLSSNAESSDILTNVFTVSIGDILEIKQKPNGMASVTSVEDIYGNEITGDYTTEEDTSTSITTATFKITPTEFDEKDLTLEYFINLDVKSYTLVIDEIKVEGHNFIFDKYETNSLDVVIIEEVKNIVFKCYEVDEYKKHITGNDLGLSAEYTVRDNGEAITKNIDLDFDIDKGIYTLKIPQTDVQHNINITIK